ncbi:hypothetical protein F5Y16DRAFT_369191 [Xylariaceae sp. FL0255]|nr:hypothetical protein F5Y16DRAFT_369191 [Xylariaceae sp. FL0255]
MSQKITPKNLTYDSSLPPFLARLRGQQTAHTGPDPILASHRRPGQKRSASEEAEDAPLVVDEEGNVVAHPDELMTDENSHDGGAGGQGEEGAKKGESEGEGAGVQEESEREKVAGIGASRKRKVGRVIGDDGSDDDTGNSSIERKKKSKDKNDEARIAKASADVRRLMGEEPEENPGNPNQKAGSRGDGKRKEPERAQSTGQEQNPKPATKRNAKKKIKLSFGDDGE